MPLITYPFPREFQFTGFVLKCVTTSPIIKPSVRQQDTHWIQPRLIKLVTDPQCLFPFCHNKTMCIGLLTTKYICRLIPIPQALSLRSLIWVKLPFAYELVTKSDHFLLVVEQRRLVRSLLRLPTWSRSSVLARASFVWKKAGLLGIPVSQTRSVLTTVWLNVPR